MRHRRPPLRLAALAAAVAALPALAAAAPVTGVVRDAAGGTLRGARVELFEPVAPWRAVKRR